MAWVPVSSYHGPAVVALQWGGGGKQADLDLSAVAYREDGALMEACYFKQRTIFNNAITLSADSMAGESYAVAQDTESLQIHLHWLPAEVKFVFAMVHLREGATTLASTGAALRLADGANVGGRFLQQVQLGQATTTGFLAVVFIRPPPHMYPPSWVMQHLNMMGEGMSFADAKPMIEEYLQGAVDPNLLANRPPDDPSRQYDLQKNASYFIDPAVPNIYMGLGWETSCDLDAHCFIFDEDYQKLDHIYKHDCNYQGVHHFGDSNSGETLRIDETIEIKLNQLPMEAKHLAFFVNINAGEVYRDKDGNVHRKPAPSNFCLVRSCFAQISDAAGRVLCSFNLSQDGLPGRTRLMCCISRYGKDMRWQMIPIGLPSSHVRDSSHARRSLVEATRPDMLRRVHITIGVLEGKDLIAKDRGGTSDPYVKVKFFDHKDKKNKVIYKTLNPKWDSPVIYEFKGMICECLERIRAKIDVYDYDRFSLNDHMGRVLLHLKDVLAVRGRGPQQQWMELGQKHGKEHKEVTGSILVTYECHSLP